MLDLAPIKARCDEAPQGGAHYQVFLDAAVYDIPALVAEVERLREVVDKRGQQVDEVLALAAATQEELDEIYDKLSKANDTLALAGLESL